MVVLYHILITSPSFSYHEFPFLFTAISEKSYIGVDFFFVLSGFIILTAHYENEEGLSSLKRYSIKRLIRIFSPFLPISVFLVTAYSINPHIGIAERKNFSVLSSLFLIPAPRPPALPASWTLIHEMVFYTIFSLYFLCRKYFLAAISVWAIIIAARLPVHWEFFTGLTFERFLGPINLEFMGGLVCAYIWRKVDAGRTAGSVLLLAGVISFAGVLCLDLPKMRWLLLFPFSLILLGGCYLEKAGAIRTPRLFLLLGDASYAIYLIHMPLFSLVFRAVPALNRHTVKLGTANEWAMTAFAALIASILVGVLYHRLYERPVIRFLHRKALSP
ncbi:acyltransferase family protein [Azospirillum sp. B2RO_4]|uniref:acyltransferase family protein n=1 Tax=Azospirillum sp. B2RO_4 TaxID=3027796 RepID=UPI003DA9CDB7